MEDGEIVEGLAMEEEPETKNGKSPYEMLRESKSSVEEIISQILSIKKDKKPKSELRELVTQMFLHFVTLRQANRSILLEEDKVKAETERAKAPVDFTTLQLHNLLYEKSHYVKAIKACKDFKSKYPDIDLVPQEDFMRHAPDHIKGPVLSHDSSHNLMLKRLNYELHQRKELCKLHEKLEQRKKSLLEIIANRKKFLSSLPSHLKSLKKASLPVQTQLGVLHSKKLKQQNSAELLPPPLYVVYSQFVAQKEAFGECIDLEIVGSLKDAQAFARQQANKDTAGTSTNVEAARLDDDAPDEEDDGQRRRKRPRRVPSKENLDHAGVYQAHPLKITLHIYDDEVSDPKSSKLITLRFEYLFKLNVVCAGVDGFHEGPENNVLCNLFPDDTGVELPHQSAKLFVGDAPAFDETRTSRPYKWAQHLAGIDFLPEVAPLLSGHETASSETAKNDVVSGLSLYRQQNRVQTVVQRIRSRKRAQLALVEQLDSLVKLKWPSLNCESVPWALHAPLCNLDGWSRSGPPCNQTSSEPVIDTDLVQEPMDVDVDRRSGTSKEESESAREDGELPSLVAPVMNDVKLTPSKISTIEHTKQLSLISKSIISPISKGKSQSLKKYDEDSDFLLDIESDKDEIATLELEVENEASAQCCKMAKKLWVDYGVKEFSLVLTRKVNAEGKSVKLEAKVKISKEYPLRPPFFAVSLYPTGEKKDGNDGSGWCNELRAMEAEVNLHMLRMLPSDQENYIIAHQVRCLAMLFDYFMDEESPFEKRSTSVVDVGLCKPVIGRLLARSFRGRDRRKMISWKDMECTSGYPY
ncbi:THO complex subunit 5B [Ricinus communis]|uniref:Fms interacting protein, putative n=1 Tax=Ricinus communis TaxID=3988 RepID=B9R7B4_RICCO|nr:THO complex subunit 5B [Ricinus communis]EEF52394.1 fms interacting protein, putative [Ricinus communis]|eukprot:XP_002510207.1 THO complex subunit 5B [Ricinus communis]